GRGCGGRRRACGRRGRTASQSLLWEPSYQWPMAKCEPGCTCKRHTKTGTKCPPGCTCARHDRTQIEARSQKISQAKTGKPLSAEHRAALKCRPGCTCKK